MISTPPINGGQPPAVKLRSWHPEEGPILDDFICWLWQRYEPLQEEYLTRGKDRQKTLRTQLVQQLLDEDMRLFLLLGGSKAAHKRLHFCAMSGRASNLREFFNNIGSSIASCKQRQAAKPPRADKGRKRLKLV